MISVMETESGLTLYRSGPHPGITRLANNHPSIAAVRALLSHEAPDAVIWTRIEQVLEDPCGWLQSWVESCGLELDRDGPDGKPVIKASGSATGHATPAPFSPITCTSAIMGYLGRLHAEGGSFKHYLKYLTSGAQMQETNGLQTLIVIHRRADFEVHLLHKVILPTYAVKGTLVDLGSAPDFPEPGDWDYGLVIDTGASPAGRVLREVVMSCEQFAREGAEILQGAMTAADGATFGVYEGLPTGWAIDESTDSFKRARQVAAEIEATGSQARILNHLSGEVCPV